MSGVRAQLREAGSAFGAVLQNPDLRRLEIAWTFSVVLHWGYLVAVSVYAFDAGGTAAVGLIYLLRMIPSAVLAPFTAVLADRYSRQLVMMASDLSRVALVGAAAACVFLDGPAAVVYALAVVAAVVATPFRPAQSALTPTLARSPAELTAANAVASSIESLAFFVGPAVAGLLLAVASIGVVFAVTAGCILWSTIFIVRIRVERRDPEPEPQQRASSTIVSEVLAGFVTVGKDARLRLLLGLLSAQTLVAGALAVLTVVLAIEVLDLGKPGVGYLEAAFGVGALVGAIATMALVGIRRLSPPFMLGVVLWGAPLALIGAWPNKVVAFALLGLMGLGNSLVDVAGFTLIQRAVPDEVLARVFGIVQMLWLGSVGIGAVLTAPIVDGLGNRGALISIGLFLPVLVLLVGPRLWRLDAAAHVPGGELELLRSVPIFAPLPGAPLEHLAGRLLPIRFAAGEEIVREGAAGDRFYVIAEGEVAVTQGRERLATLGAGGYFGEIALLRDVPRTASVVALTPVTVYALDRADFLAAVTSHTPSARAAEQVVAARLPTAAVPSEAAVPG